MATPFIGQIMMFGGNFAIRGWAICSGQLLSISQNTALFSILGTTYGGNGQTTFALPDLRGRTAIGWGTGPGLPTISLGEVGGEYAHTLISTEMPTHTHPIQTTMNANSGPATDSIPNGNFLASDNQYAASANTTMNASAVQATANLAGGNQPHNNMQPYLGITFLIALQGAFPSRN